MTTPGELVRSGLIVCSVRHTAPECPAGEGDSWLVGQILVDPRTVDVIVQLSDRGWSLRRIARLLDLEGRPTPRGRTGWRHSTVRKILVREADRRSASGDSATTPHQG